MAKKSLTKEEIEHLGHLANLQLNDVEIKKYQSQIGETLDYVKNLEELDTSKAEPTNQAGSLQNVDFQDGEKNDRNLSADKAVSNSNNKKDDYFVVKRIL